MDPRLDTGGWLTLTESHCWLSSRQGLSLCKIRRTLLGAITLNKKRFFLMLGLKKMLELLVATSNELF